MYLSPRWNQDTQACPDFVYRDVEDKLFFFIVCVPEVLVRFSCFSQIEGWGVKTDKQIHRNNLCRQNPASCLPDEMWKIIYVINLTELEHLEFHFFLLFHIRVRLWTSVLHVPNHHSFFFAHRFWSHLKKLCAVSFIPTGLCIQHSI